jgi:hypothetical protein
MWRYEAPYVVNEKGKVLDVDGQIDGEGRHIAATPKNGNIAQHWDIVFVDDWTGEPGKGELNEDFGLYVQRPFYIVSAMNSHRYLDLINNRNMVIKTRNGRNTQTWWFDQVSLTIKTKLNNQSWDIKSSGRTREMQIWSTNSNWW